MNERTAERQGKHMGRQGQPRKNLERALDHFGNREENKISVNDIVKMTGAPSSTIYANAKDR
nr:MULTISPECIES: hypothetical protein [unclassified Bacillus (in: firmicutes)]